ncbi:probable tRNA N6-adenosine threonylcarbamoyltransferase, mitochondrial [Sinocyclocheilus grahami]|nr:PREDICTED: probable tRNA N6-adenosine threonylcarbamoyltransferase, mitochondrial [Sinocyclocheilus grahami]
MASHIAKRTHRAILFCKSKGLLPQHKPTLVVSGGVASNEYIRQTLKIVTDATGLHLLCPPSKFCTDNGVMIAWNGIERLKQGKGIMSHCEEVTYEPKAPLGLEVKVTSEVKDAAIKIPRIKTEDKFLTLCRKKISYILINDYLF